MVLLKVQVSNQHFRSYYQENSLVIQLILKELNDIYSLIPSLQSHRQLELANHDEWLSQLHIYLTNLIGEQEAGAFFSCKKGPLTHLKNYCQHFQLIDAVQDRPLINLSFQVNQIYLNAQQLRHFMHSFEISHSQHKKNTFFVKIQKNIQTILSSIDNILKLFLICLKKFTDNENVIFFLLRKKILLIKIYGLKITSRLFKTFSKKQSLSSLLIKRFKSRGFDHLLPIIKRELFFYESNQIAYC